MEMDFGVNIFVGMKSLEFSICNGAKSADYLCAYLCKVRTYRKFIESVYSGYVL